MYEEFLLVILISYHLCWVGTIHILVASHGVMFISATELTLVNNVWRNSFVPLHSLAPVNGKSPIWWIVQDEEICCHDHHSAESLKDAGHTLQNRKANEC